MSYALFRAEVFIKKMPSEKFLLRVNGIRWFIAIFVLGCILFMTALFLTYYYANAF